MNRIQFHLPPELSVGEEFLQLSIDILEEFFANGKCLPTWICIQDSSVFFALDRYRSFFFLAVKFSTVRTIFPGSSVL